MEKQVTVAEYSSWSRAHIARGRLEAEGIPCVLLNTSMNVMHGGWIAIQVRIPAEAWEHAVAVLADIDFDDPTYI